MMWLEWLVNYIVPEKVCPVLKIILTKSVFQGRPWFQGKPLAFDQSLICTLVIGETQTQLLKTFFGKFLHFWIISYAGQNAVVDFGKRIVSWQ